MTMNEGASKRAVCEYVRQGECERVLSIRELGREDSLSGTTRSSLKSALKSIRSFAAR